MPKQQTKDLCRNVKVSVPESKISGMEMKSVRMAGRFRQKYKTLRRGASDSENKNSGPGLFLFVSLMIFCFFTPIKINDLLAKKLIFCK